MSLFNMLKSDKEDTQDTRTAIEQARDPSRDHGGAVGDLVTKLLEVGIDGKGPMKSARALAKKAQQKHSDPSKAIEALIKDAIITGAAGGFITNWGGFITMPIAIPANVLEFYLQATRLTASIAHVRGYSLEDETVRSAILLTLVSSKADDILSSIGIGGLAGSTVTSLARKKLPPGALMLLNKAIGFQLLKSVGVKTFSKVGRAVPLLGGGIGALLDTMMMRRIADQAKKEFPAKF